MPQKLSKVTVQDPKTGEIKPKKDKRGQDQYRIQAGNDPSDVLALITLLAKYPYKINGVPYLFSDAYFEGGLWYLTLESTG